MTAMDTGRWSDLDFHLPPERLATAPAEERGVARDGVRMMVATPDGISHRRALDLPEVLQPGDVLVLNNSRTMPASVQGRLPDGERVEIHLSTVLLSSGLSPARAQRARRSEWVVEVRRPQGRGGAPSFDDRTGAVVRLAGGGTLTVHGSHPAGATHSRLWEATVRTPVPLSSFLSAHGDPIRYDYVARDWPIADYRTVFGDQPGSAEMPSAGRPLTWRLLSRLVDRGVQVEFITLHCGVSSAESHEPPYDEWFEVPERTADAVTTAHRDGRRVIAVGTTVVRALESVTDGHGGVFAGRGWTDLVITPDRTVSTVDGMISGWHEPEASHLAMLTAVAGRDILAASYAAALAGDYLWHEFGDIHLMLR